MEQRAVARAIGHTRPADARHHGPRDAHQDRRPDDRDHRRDDPGVHDHGNGNARPLRDRRRRATAHEYEHRPLHLRDEGQPRGGRQRGMAWHGRDHRARPSRRAAGCRPRQRNDHVDADLPRQRDSLRPPALNAHGEPPIRCRAVSLDGARLFHINVNCSDLDRSRRFYTEGLGLTIGAHTAPEVAQAGTAFGLDRARWDASILLGPRGYDGGAIDLLQWHEPTPTGAPPAGITETGFQRLGIRVPDLDAAIDRVRALDAAIWSEPFAHALNGGGEIRLVVVSDPDGTAIELIEGAAPSVSFVAITCRDLDRSRDFYVSLGFREVARYPSENVDGSHLRV